MAANRSVRLRPTFRPFGLHFVKVGRAVRPFCLEEKRQSCRLKNDGAPGRSRTDTPLGTGF